MENDLFSPHDPEFAADPFPKYERLRALDPVHFSSKGFWVLTTYEDVSAALMDTRLSNMPSKFALLHERNSERYVAAKVAQNIVAFTDSPRHAPLRSLLTTSFNASLQGIGGIFGEVADHPGSCDTPATPSSRWLRPHCRGKCSPGFLA